MAKEPRILTFDEFADELLVEKQGRALVILAAAKVDLQLGALIEAFLLPRAVLARPDELLEGDSPLATFSSRIKIARRLGLIDDRLATALDKLRGVRNQAAHWVSFGITDAPLNDQIRYLQSLVKGRRSYSLTVARFFGESPLTPHESLQATLLTLSAILESIRDALESGSATKLTKAMNVD